MARQSFSPGRNDRNALVQLPDSADDLPDTVEVNLDDKNPENFTVVEMDDTPEEDRGKPLTYEPSLDEQADDLAKYSGKRDAQSRIKRLGFERETERRRADAAEREREAAINMARAAQAEANDLRQRVYQGGTALAESMISRNEASMAAAKSRLSKAHEDGDGNEMAEAQADIARLAAEEIAIRTRTPTEAPQQQPLYQPPQAAPTISPNVVAWVSRNPWFNQDKTKTDLAMSIHRTLVARGVDPSSEAYTRELDRGVNAVYGTSEPKSGYDSQPRREGSRPNANADGSRDSGTPSGEQRTVTLTRSELSLAKRLGVSPKDYAVQKMRRERLDKGEGA